MICSSLLLLFGCSKEPGVPLSFYLSNQEQSGPIVVPTNKAALVVTEIELVAPEVAQRRVTIKLLAADASSFEKLTTDNFGKTLVIVQGTNLLAAPKIKEPILAQASVVLPIGTNVDFEHTYWELRKLSRE